ncbi:MAG: WD40/YVTN/BNR-like repeat-containing protein [Gammaproteobacteria bacterium]
MFNPRRYWTCGLALVLAVAALAAFAAPVPQADLLQALQWRSVGPYTGGRVTSVAGVAAEPNLFYAAYAGGGVWKTEDYGYNWESVFPDNMNIGAIAVAPSNAQVIYVGTGDSAPRNTVMTMGDGMYKSTDGGKTWSHIGLENTHVISWIVVDPSNPDVVYAAALGHVWAPNTERGVYKTTDGGQTWKKVLYINDGTGAITLAMDPSKPRVVYATMWQFSRQPWGFSSGGPDSGIFKTTDGGAHWSNITHAPGLPKGIFGKAGIAVAPSEPNVVYALVQAKTENPNKPGGLYRSDNGGQSWTLVNDSSELTQRAFYYMRVYVDPKDASTIYLPNVNVFVSHDSGKTLIALRPPHGDNHAFWINPDDPQVFIEGNDGGASVTRDGGKTWSTEDNQPTGQFYHINLDDQFPFHIYAAQQDRSAVVGPSAVNFGKIPAVWGRAAGGENSWVVPQPGKWWITYGSGYYSLMDSFDSRTEVDRSIDPSPIYHVGAPASELTYRSNWSHHPIMFMPNNPGVLLNGTQYVLKSTDFGQIWTKISPDLTRNDKSRQGLPGGPISKDISGAEIYDTISAMDVSPLNDNVIWTGSDDGLVYVTQDGGGHWTRVTPQGLPEWIKITCIDASQTTPGTAYLTASRYQWDDFKPYVYVTTDYGKHWTSLANGLPADQYLNAVRQDPNDPGMLFVATSKTVFLSLDNGAHWEPLTLNLPPVRVSDLAIQAQQHAVVLATYGRGIWVLDNLQYLEQLGRAQVTDTAPYLFTPQQTWLTQRSSFSFGGGSAGGANAPGGATVFFYLPQGYTGTTPVKLSFTTAAGEVINSYDLPLVPKPNGTTNKVERPRVLPTLHAGMNHFQWDLRYPPAIYPNGYFISETGRIEAPTVVPGTYYAVLDYNGTALKEPFVIKLDPRLSTTQEQLQARNDLLLKINDTLNTLNMVINQATNARSRLQKAVAGGQVPAARARDALAALDRDIDAMVNFKIQSGEGDLVYETRVAIRLIQLAGDIQQSYTPLKPQNVLGFSILFQHAQQGEQHLQSDVAAVKKLLGS